MDSQRGTATYDLERVFRTLVKRCVECPTNAQPACPACASNEICSLIPQDCNTCAYSVCVPKPNSPSTSQPGPNVGAIAGGVVGGIALIAVVVFLLWFFWIRKKRAQQEAAAEEWEEDEIAQQKAAFQSMLHDAASTRTRGSLAGSFLSRASNVIQIAFIPGVTTRNGSSQNSMLATSPVPPIPAARGTPRSPLSNKDDAIFFRPGDIRDSSYSGNSSMLFDRRDTQYSIDSRASSIAPNSVYHESLTIQPLPSAQARGMARMVSVKSGSPLATPNEGTAASASPDNAAFAANVPSGKGVQILMPGQRSQGGVKAKAQEITLGGKSKGRFPVRTPLDAISAAEGNAKHSPVVSSPLRDANNDTDEDEEEHARARKSLLKTSPQPAQSPFFDETDSLTPKANPYASLSSSVGSKKSVKRGKSMGGLSAVIEEATRKASTTPEHEGLGGKRDSSPFNDENKID